MSIQVTLTINDDLYRRARQIARSRQQDVAEVLAESITLTEMAEDFGASEDGAIERENAAYLALHDTLLEKYRGEYVALYHGEVIAHGSDFGTVFTYVNQQHPDEFVMIRRVEADPEPVYHFRSPKLVVELSQ
jgi:hypothetical protein